MKRVKIINFSRKEGRKEGRKEEDIRGGGGGGVVVGLGKKMVAPPKKQNSPKKKNPSLYNLHNSCSGGGRKEGKRGVGGGHHLLHTFVRTPLFRSQCFFSFFLADKRNEGRVEHRYADSLFIGTFRLRNSLVAGPANQPARPT